MSEARNTAKDLRTRICAGAPVLGVFVRTPSIHVVEVLGGARLDFIVLDAEHAPFDLASLDHCLLAARAARTPALVRIPGKDPKFILQALDLGAAGVIVPHVQTRQDAESIVAAARYDGAGRGFSASHRAADYGAADPWAYVKESDESVIVIAQIEDDEGLKNASEIASTKGLSAVFIGPADLANSLGEKRFGGPITTRAIENICAAARNAKMAIGSFTSSTDNIAAERKRGVSLFAVSTDQALLRNAAQALSDNFHRTCGERKEY